MAAEQGAIAGVSAGGQLQQMWSTVRPGIEVATSPTPRFGKRRLPGPPASGCPPTRDVFVVMYVYVYHVLTYHEWLG